MRWVLLLALLAGPARSEELLVFAAASTAEPMTELGQRFEQESGVKVRFSFGASSELARQILAGAPADVFLSADQAQMDRAEKGGRLDRSVPLLGNTLELIVPAASKETFATRQELLRIRHLALADPEAVPAGVYAKRWLKELGLWEALQPKVIPTADVRAALAAVASGRVDAGIVYSTDARISKEVRVVRPPWRVEPGFAIRYPIAAVNGPRRETAQRLIHFLSNPESQAVFQRYGFLRVQAK